MISSFLPLVPTGEPYNCSAPSSCPRESISGQIVHFICLAAYLRTIRLPVQVLGSDKKGPSPHALGQRGRSFGGWVCGCRGRSKGSAMRRKELLEADTPADRRGPAHTAAFPDPSFTIKRTSSKQAVLGAPFHPQSNSTVSAEERGLEHPTLVQLNNYPLKVIIAV